MFEPEWEDRSLYFQTRIAKSYLAELIWDTFDVRDQDERKQLQDEIQRALFADEKTINRKDQELVCHITERCMDQSEDKDIIRIGVLYACVRTKKPEYGRIVPIFRVQNCSQEPQNCNIIDHLGNVYEHFENYLQNNTWQGVEIMIPSRAQYKLNENGVCRVEIHGRTSSAVEETIFDNITVAGEPPTSDIMLSEERIFNSIMLMQQAHKVRSAHHKKQLPAEHHITFDALSVGFRENVQPGAIKKTQGDRKFLQHMDSVPDLTKYYENINLENGKFNINQQLKIHPRAFVQIPECDRYNLLKLTKQYNDKEISKEKFHQEVGSIRKNYKFVLETERASYKEYLISKFGVSELRDVYVGDKNVFADLDPHEIDRLHQVIKQSLNGDERYIKHGTNFAAKMKAENLTEFCAAAEYLYTKVKRELKVRKDNNRKPEGRGNLKLNTFYENQIINEIIDNDFQDIVRSFQDLINECNAERENFDPTFRNSFAAANHYFKHKNLPNVDPNNALSPKTYFEIACDMTSEPWSEVRWTQDGSSLRCTYFCESRRAVAIKFVSLADRTGVIATLMDNEKNKQCEKLRYYYHPEY